MSALLEAPPPGGRKLWDNSPKPPRDWQVKALPEALYAIDNGKRGVLWVVTGGGKSIEISELARLISSECMNSEVVVVSTPTQSLVKQLSETIGLWCGARNVGQFYSDRKEIRRIIVTCNPSLPKLHEALVARSLSVRLLICDECHGSESETIKKIMPTLDPRAAIGFTATPFRGNNDEALSLWDELLYRYTFADALRDGVLVPFKTINWDGSGPDDNVDRITAEMIRDHTTGPGIVSALSIKDAEEYAEFLSVRGVPAMAIYGSLSEKEKTQRLAALKAGSIRALVHCQLLSEGVDLPWLRWIGLRRPVQSPVRFVQELGRVLRIDYDNPEKTFAVVLDPHDLVGIFGLSQNAKIGEALDAVIEKALEEKEKKEPSLDPDRQPMPPAQAIDAATSWSRMLLICLQANGLAPASQASGAWRTRRPSDRQIGAILGSNGKKGLDRMAKYLPEPSRTTVKLLCQPHVLENLQCGAVSDLMSILVALANATFEDRKGFATGNRPVKPWKFPESMEVPPLDTAAIFGLKAA